MYGFATNPCPRIMRLNSKDSIYLLTIWITDFILPVCIGIYRQTSNKSHTKSQNLDISRLVLQMSFPNPLKPGVKWIMKMLFGAAPTGDAPGTSEWSTISLPTKLHLIFDALRYLVYCNQNFRCWKKIQETINYILVLDVTSYQKWLFIPWGRFLLLMEISTSSFGIKAWKINYNM